MADVCSGLCPGSLSRGFPCPPRLQPKLHCGPSVLSLPLSLLLEQSILWVLRDAGSPVETAQLLKKCQVPKKKLNQVLYRMKKESQVARVGPTMWCLGDGGTGKVVPAEVAQPSQGNLPSWGGSSDQIGTVLALDKFGFGPACEHSRCPSWVRDVPSPCLDFLFWPMEITLRLLHRVARGLDAKGSA